MKERILQYLRENKTITSLEAMQEVGTTDLQHYIMVLRQEGYNITDKWIKSKNRYNDKIQYKEYMLGE